MQVRIEGTIYSLAEGSTLFQAASLLGKEEDFPVLAYVNGRLRELFHTVPDGAEVRFVRRTDQVGFDAVRRSACMLLLAAADAVRGSTPGVSTLHFSIASGFYFTFTDRMPAEEDFIRAVDMKMREMIRDKVRFEKRSVPTEEARRLFADYGLPDKEMLFRTRIASKVNLYRLGGYEDYYYGYMVYDTSMIGMYELLPYRDGIVLNLPRRSDPLSIPAFTPSEKLMTAQLEGEAWADRQGIETVGRLNDRIIRGEASETILVSEALQESRIAETAALITSNPSVKFVMIAGPSSSGKTTFSQRLCIQLRAHGMIPHYVGVDNYFINRADMVPGPDGKIDFEALSAVDVAGFNRDMTALLNGETVAMPTFDFIQGKRVYLGEKLSLKDGEILVIEGIHCLNEELSASLPAESKFRVYITALTQLNIDEHNRIPSADGRLLRRIIRDYRTRGYSASQTIALWDMVRAGEEKNIFPYQDSTDVFFNSALPYEIAALKTYAQPLLFQVREDDPSYQEAKRLLKFLDYFIAVPAEGIPVNSIIREFIGGGCFHM